MRLALPAAAALALTALAVLSHWRDGAEPVESESASAERAADTATSPKETQRIPEKTLASDRAMLEAL